ncbi:MAG TPA: hypothetical protein VFT79_08800 [Solirubrobacterales bacterium]|nr:hypothetical protein [Solirubrobacterales bacterium]
MRRLGLVVAAGIALFGAAALPNAAAAQAPTVFMSCGFAPIGGPGGASKGSITYRQQPDRCHYSGDGSTNDLINLVDIQWEDWGQPVARATGKRVDNHDQDRNGFQRHPVQIAVKGPRPAVGDADKLKLFYTKLVVTFEDGESYVWSLYRPTANRSKPQQRRTCGFPPDGMGAYSYIQTWGIRCAPAFRIAFRARRRFCKQHDDCEIDPAVNIRQIHRGKTRYRGWSCKVKVGYESTRMHCRKSKMRLIYRSAA